MTDFYSVLQRAVASLPEASGPQRRAVYDKARKALLKQLQSFDPPLPSSDVTAQRLALEDAIRKLEADIVRNARTRRAVESAMPKPAETAGAEAGGSANPLGAAAAPRRAEEPAERRPAPGGAPRHERPAPARREPAGELASFRRDGALKVPERPAAPPPPDDNVVAGPEEAAPPFAEDEEAFAPHDHEPDLAPGEPIAEQDEALDAPESPADRGRGKAEAEAGRPRRRFGLFSRGEKSEGQDAKPGRRRRDKRRRDKAPREADRRRVAPAVTREADHPRAGEAEPEPFPDDEEAYRDPAFDKEIAEERAAAAVVPAGPRRNAFGEVDEGEDVLTGRLAAERAARHPRNRNRRVARVILSLAILFILAGAGVVAWLERDVVLATVASLGGTDEGRLDPVAAGGERDPDVPKNDERLATPGPEQGEDVRRVRTTRIVAPGTEGEADTDAGVSEVTPEVGTDAAGTPGEVAALDPGAAPDSAQLPRTGVEADVDAVREGAPDAPATAGSGQSAVLYEEAAQIGEQGAALAGTVTWELARQSIGGGDPEPVILATAAIPDRDLTANILIRANRDGALPASHLIEVSFELPETFAGDGIANVPGLIMKETEEARGNALRGAAARVSSNLFWIALSNSDQEREVNLEFLRDREWIDIPILYENGRRAILTLQKGDSGEVAVEDALAAWNSG